MFVITLFTVVWSLCLLDHLVEELKQFGAGLVDGADDGSSSLSQSFQQRHHLETGRAVQTTETQRHRGHTQSLSSVLVFRVTRKLICI